MLIPLSWLKEFVDIKISFKELSWKLSEVGLTVEKWEEKNGDIIFDPEVTPNRPDWMSVYGIAREIAAVTNTHLKPKSQKLVIPKKIKNPLEIKINPDYKLASKTTTILFRNVTVKPSPEWLQKRIFQIGLRPINNLVDITNFVLWLYGNPLHVFDYDKILGNEMTVSLTKGGEKFRSLDGIDYILPKNAIVIKDKERIIDLPPIKGGENTAVSSTTRNILLHSIVCDPVLTRRASQALNLRSDSSAISERGVDSNGTTKAAIHTSSLILDLAQGEIASNILNHEEKEFKPWTVIVNHHRMERILGIKIEPKRVKEIFERLTLNSSIAAKQGNTIYRVVIPTYRNDLHIEEDLIEEVARIYGYNNFPKTLPSGPVPTAPVAYERNYDFEYKVKQFLTACGYSEIYTYSLISEKQLINLGIDPNETLRVDNPISRDFEYLRPHLLGNLLEALKINLPNFPDVKLFELGKVYLGEILDAAKEEYSLSTISSGSRFFEAKGETELILNRLGINYQIKPFEKEQIKSWLHPTRAALVTSGKELLGNIAEIHPSVLAKFGISSPVTRWYLNYNLLEKLANKQSFSSNKTKRYQPIPQFPPTIEDLSFIINEKVEIAKIIEILKSIDRLIVGVSLLDSFDNTQTFRITYQSPIKTLSSEDVAKIRDKIIKTTKEKLGISLRE